MSITVISFGYGHPDGPPTAHVTWDVRDLFRDPHIDPAMRQMTGLDNAVVANVLAQPGARDFLRSTINTVRDLTIITPDLTVAYGCVGGRHRSVAFARAVHARFADGPLAAGVTVVHRDIDKPVLQR